ncbi:ATPase, AAA-type, core domain protein [Candidatus Magnetomorum sp. HK-1]|nr:ATPase, AAA-type, core domain protein [Candidatus Magnetomorum sp. HK-1]
MKFFNTAGPVNPKKHYVLSPLGRLDSHEILSLIDQEKYFTLHAPRQTGKTSCLLELMNYLNQGEKYDALYINIEAAQAERENISGAMQVILSEFATCARFYLKNTHINDIWPKILEKTGNNAFSEILTQWTEASERPTVLFIDEIDSLVGDSLISVLRQLRAGYNRRPLSFPQSIVLCGIRDVRDYRIHSSSEKAIITGGSAFNIKAKSLHLGSFSKVEMTQLYQCHTDETGQKFSDNALEIAWLYSEGQPWIVNAIGYEVCYEMKDFRDRSITITKNHMQQAVENLILRRDTHIDQLLDKLQEERVRRVIEPIMTNKDDPKDVTEDDILYVRDLGLIKIDKSIRIANQLYKEVIPRALTFSTQVTITHDSSWYVNADGALDINKLMLAFQDFFRKHFDEWSADFQYQEASVQLLLQAFLQRIVNSGGYIFREYGLGRKRTDLLVTWYYQDSKQEIVIELKIRYQNTDKVIQKGLIQTAEYMDKCGATEGHLVIFDRRKSVSWEEKIFHKVLAHEGKTIMVWGM